MQLEFAMKQFVLVLLFICAEQAFPASNAPFFYQVTFGGNTSYLLGTHHYGISANELPEHVLHNLKSAQFLLLEADIEALGLMGRNSLEGDLSQLLTPNAWSFVVNHLGHKFSLAEIKRLTPWYASNLLGLVKMGYDLNNLKRMDYEILQIAQTLKTNTVFLASTQAHIRLYQLTQPLEGIEEMAQTLPTNAFRLETKLLLEAFRRGDEAEQIQSNDRLPPPARSIFIDERNLSWLPIIKTTMAKGRSFVAVGTSHLFGKVGLLNLLKQEGATIERILDCEEVLNVIAPAL